MENTRRGDRPRKFNTAEKAGKRTFGKRREDAPAGKRKPSFEESGEKRGFRDKGNFRTKSEGRYDQPRSHNDGFQRSEKPRFGEKSHFDDKPRYSEKRSFRSDEERNERSSFKSADRRERGNYGEKKFGDRSQRSGFSSKARTAGGYEKRRNDPRERRFNDSARDERRDIERTRYYENDHNDRRDRFSKKPQGSRSERFEQRDDSGEIRLNRYIAQSGICSRREADEMIALGEVKVNGVVVTEMGTKVTRDDIVIVNEERIKNEKLVYLVLNKPKGYITSLDDPEGRDTVMELVKHACKERIYPVGRLDRNTTGILLMTNDGDLAKKLTHPSHQIRKVYHVNLDKALTQSDMQKIMDGVILEDGLAKADVIAYVGNGSDKKDVGIELHSGKNRIVRRIFEHLDYKVVKLDRVSFAGITKKDLPRGRWRFLEDREISFLKMV